MIPSDLASRLRTLMDGEIKPLLNIQEIPHDLPDLESGQRFQAQIQSPLPDGTFRALVAGRTVTLALPSGAKSGDVMELVVTGNKNQTITAKFADTQPAPQAPTASAAQTRLSAAGQLISQLLTGRNETQPAALNRSTPLLPAPPTRGSELSPVLQQAIESSGLFYEAHQAQWVGGAIPVATLAQEPQALIAQQAAPEAETTPEQAQRPANASQPQAPVEHEANLRQTADNAAQRQTEAHTPAARDLQRAETSATGTPSERAPLRIAEQLMPIVQQQLETLATHQAVWQGQIWPGQMMQLEIQEPENQSAGQGDDSSAEQNEAQAWQSTMRLSMPTLGGLEARLIVTPAGVAIRINSNQTNSIVALKTGEAELSDALSAAGVPLTGFAVLYKDEP